MHPLSLFGGPHAAVLGGGANYSGGVAVFSNLNLNGRTPLRVQPKVGIWGPEGVPTTRAKKRMRIWVSLAFVLAVAVITFLGYTFYKALL